MFRTSDSGRELPTLCDRRAENGESGVGLDRWEEESRDDVAPCLRSETWGTQCCGRLSRGGPAADFGFQCFFPFDPSIEETLNFPSKSHVKQNISTLLSNPYAMNHLPQKKNGVFPMPNPVSLK